MKIDPAPAFLLSRCWCWLETPCMSTHTHITQIVARCSSWSCTLRRTQAAGLLFPRSDNHAGACPLPAFVVLASHPFLSPPTEVTARTFAFNGERRGTGFRGVTHTHAHTHMREGSMVHRPRGSQVVIMHRSIDPCMQHAPHAVLYIQYLVFGSGGKIPQQIDRSDDREDDEIEISSFFPYSRKSHGISYHTLM